MGQRAHEKYQRLIDFCQALVGWMCGVFFVYAALFGVGAFLMGNMALAQVWG